MSNTQSYLPGQEPEIAPGVHGVVIEEDSTLWIPVIWAQNEGNGDVGRFLDTLPRDKTVRFPNVIHGKLAVMLARREFHKTEVWSPEFQENIEVWERLPI